VLDGRAGLATDLAREALRACEEFGEWGFEAHTLRVLADVASAREPFEAETAATHYRRAIARADSLGMRPLSAECHLGLGMVQKRAGEAGDAIASLERARTLFRDLGMLEGLARADAARSAPDLRASL
jgi:hypothetical protein